IAMAAKPSLSSLLRRFAFIFIVMCGSASASPGKILHAREKKMFFYVQEITKGPNTSVRIVGRMYGLSSNISSFGTVFVVDDPNTEGPEHTFKLLGGLQDFEANSDHRGTNFHLTTSLIFENGDTLESAGTIRTLLVQRKLSVVGGSGQLIFAHGHALVNIVSFDGVLLTFMFDVKIRS
ncbi:hypothetical protein KI387_017923, partial [Taxus chinensis]